MGLNTTFTDAQLRRINLQSILYLCACPSQVGEQISNLRQLYDYQANCSNRSQSAMQDEVHARIAEATRQAHAIMEQCLQDILALEAWDPVTLEMPDNIRVLLERELETD